MTNRRSPSAYPAWESLSLGTNSLLVNDDTGLDPALDFLRLRWNLSHSAVQVLDNAADLQNRNSRKPFSQDDSYAQSSICETPISTVAISIYELAEWQRIWKKGHDSHFYILKTTGENSCGCKPEDAPASPILTITAPDRKFITIRQYVQEVFQWLQSLEQPLREAIGQFNYPLDPEWSLTPMPLINRVFIYNDRPGANLEAMEYASKQRETIAHRKSRDKEIEANPSLVGATDCASLKLYLPLTGQTQMPLSLEFSRLQ
ncbi:uncharacterized protein K489DRAFT_374890 [Dissoconium aciculare CBS 342.82]|uniref:Uncharacterized protein n=1 Tax=Dissoconium aciculare CBS 342.82 TaxID=1314786 RepID=A0A6J3LP39_9PEZI|nr:uncharacterized protein K489DRAFT_374890 [Dissoconium aciculare CBS 342.82]KAF1817731.1 hypothetical protein K489DRAFT_374890 [Dissoconium aciculare CBS 342.82]